jgi:hypothetical protein
MQNGTAVIQVPSVYIHQSEGRPAVDPGTGWTEEAILRIGDAHVNGAFSEGCGRHVDDVHYLSDGSLKMGALVSDNLIPIPLDTNAEVELTLESCGHTIRIRGTSAHLELLGEAGYVEEFRP